MASRTPVVLSCPRPRAAHTPGPSTKPIPLPNLPSRPCAARDAVPLPPGERPTIPPRSKRTTATDDRLDESREWTGVLPVPALRLPPTGTSSARPSLGWDATHPPPIGTNQNASQSETRRSLGREAGRRPGSEDHQLRLVEPPTVVATTPSTPTTWNESPSHHRPPQLARLYRHPTGRELHPPSASDMDDISTQRKPDLFEHPQRLTEKSLRYRLGAYAREPARRTCSDRPATTAPTRHTSSLTQKPRARRLQRRRLRRPPEGKLPPQGVPAGGSRGGRVDEGVPTKRPFLPYAHACSQGWRAGLAPTAQAKRNRTPLQLWSSR